MKQKITKIQSSYRFPRQREARDVLEAVVGHERTQRPLMFRIYMYLGPDRPAKTKNPILPFFFFFFFSMIQYQLIECKHVGLRQKVG